MHVINLFCMGRARTRKASAICGINFATLKRTGRNTGRTMNRAINFLRHPITSRQALAMLIDHWRSGNTKVPMILITPQRQSIDYAKRIRVIFAKEKAKYPADAQMHYGFVLSEPFPWTEETYQ